MPIQLLCPNGHKLSCPDEQAGKAGKCPKCGIAFRVPVPPPPDEPSSEATPGDDSSGPAGAAPSEGTIQFAAAAAGSAATPPAARAADSQPSPTDIVVFLCPNGHRLNGPRNMVGKAGQCPHCHSRFIIPDPDEIEVEEADDDEQPSAAIDRPDLQLEFFRPPSVDELPIIDVEELPDKASASKSHLPEPPPPQQHPTAALLEQLWEYRLLGAKVELHLSDGKLLMPEGYAVKLSRGNHAVFAVREGSGACTLTAVSWESIARIVVRGVEDIPASLFAGLDEQTDNSHG